MSDILVCDRPADDCYSTATRPAWNAWKGVSWEMLASRNPRFGTPGKRVCRKCGGSRVDRRGRQCGYIHKPDAIPLRPLVVMAQKCIGCIGSGRYYVNGDEHGPCVNCSGTGFSGRVGAREVRARTGSWEEQEGRTSWSLAITGDVTREDAECSECGGTGLTDAAFSPALRTGTHVEECPACGDGLDLQKILEQVALNALPGDEGCWEAYGPDISWRGLALVDGSLYVVGVVAAGELPEGWEWLEWVPDPAGGIKVGTKGLGWWNRHPSDFDPLSRALCPELGRLLGG